MLRQAVTLEAIGRYQLEAALQSAHAHRRRTGHNNWAEVVQLYEALSAITDSPVVAINRALAIGEVHGAEAAADALKDIAADDRLSEYQPYWAARAELLSKTGAHDEARQAYEMAIGLERDPTVRAFLQKRLATLISVDDPLTRQSAVENSYEKTRVRCALSALPLQFR